MCMTLLRFAIYMYCILVTVITAKQWHVAIVRKRVVVTQAHETREGRTRIKYKLLEQGSVVLVGNFNSETRVRLLPGAGTPLEEVIRPWTMNKSRLPCLGYMFRS